jgi:4-oxalocrotonate tautomerase
MPHVIVKAYPGSSEEQKKQLAEDITRSVMTVLGKTEASVSVSFEEVEPADWVSKVYKPDILDKWDGLYKEPGYDPLK